MHQSFQWLGRRNSRWLLRLQRNQTWISSLSSTLKTRRSLANLSALRHSRNDSALPGITASPATGSALLLSSSLMLCAGGIATSSLNSSNNNDVHCVSTTTMCACEATALQESPSSHLGNKPSASAVGKTQEKTKTSGTASKQSSSTTTTNTDKEKLREPFHVTQAYEIQEILGEGGFGQVFLATRKADGQRVALKAMPRQYTNPQGFAREAHALRRLSTPPVGPHPHICQLFDWHADDKHYYLVMELIQGGELLEHLLHYGPYSEAQAASFLRQFAEALCSMHSAGITHADLKPENLLLSSTDMKDAQLKLVDFGCAVLQEEKEDAQQQQQQDDVPGTPFYWPPELFRDDARLTPATDLWAAGVIVYILLTGSHPFDKYACASEDEVAHALKQVGKEQEQYKTHKLLDHLVFNDDRLQGLSESCLDLMRQLMHPDPVARMTADEFRRHPWVQGLTASWKKMNTSHNKLQTFWRNRFRAEIIKKFAATTTAMAGVSSSDKSNELSEEQLANMFRSLDLKQNGVLELEEMQHAFRSLGVSDDDIADIFKSADLDGSGVIQYDEFCALMKNGKLETFWQDRFRREIQDKFAASLGISPGKDALSEEDLERIFNALDLKKNHVLELEEIGATLTGLGVPEKEIEQIFSSADLDGTGVIHLDEFKEIMKKNVDEGLGLQLKYRRRRFRSGILKKFETIKKQATSHEEKFREMFEAIDLDGNGVLDANELRVLLRSVGETEDVISRIVASVDMDQDGGVSWEEFVEVMHAADGDEADG